MRVVLAGQEVKRSVVSTASGRRLWAACLVILAALPVPRRKGGPACTGRGVDPVCSQGLSRALGSTVLCPPVTG